MPARRDDGPGFWDSFRLRVSNFVFSRSRVPGSGYRVGFGSRVSGIGWVPGSRFGGL